MRTTQMVAGQQTHTETQILDLIDIAWELFAGEPWLVALAARSKAGMALRTIAVETLTAADGGSKTLDALREQGRAAGMSGEERASELNLQAQLWARAPASTAVGVAS